MSKFNIGDRVVVKGWMGDDTYFEGAKGYVLDHDWYVRVRFDHAPNRDLLVRKEELELAPAKPELTEAQAAGVAGGLQEHSVGDLYPWAVVMYEHEGERLIAIENLQTGEVNAIHGRAINWGTFEAAYKRLEGRPITNVAKGRVMRDESGWVVVQVANQVRVTRLHSMLHRGQDTNSSGS